MLFRQDLSLCLGFIYSVLLRRYQKIVSGVFHIRAFESIKGIPRTCPLASLSGFLGMSLKNNTVHPLSMGRERRYDWGKLLVRAALQ
ncbi:hypothetical protein BDR22DRAFT_963972 [Usnea florida]